MNFLKKHSPLSVRNAPAFTLIELLVVIAIIAILMGILFPAAGSAITSAKKTTARNQAVQIATAITAYETEYGRLPSNTSGQFDTTLVGTLCTTNDGTNNPRAVLFLEATAWKSGKGGTNGSGFCDPWGTPYSLRLDTNYANLLTNMPSQTNPGSAVTMGTNLTKHVGVWTVFTNGSSQFLINSWD